MPGDGEAGGHPATIPAAARTHPATILIVDDEPTFAETLEGLLAAEGFATEVAASGREALGRAWDAPPDLILLDVEMPEVDDEPLIAELVADALVLDGHRVERAGNGTEVLEKLLRQEALRGR